MALKRATAHQVDRRARVFKELLAGKSFSEIGRITHVSLATVKKDVKFVMDEVAAQTIADAEDYRKVELKRLEDLWNAIWPDALEGKVSAIDRLLKIQDQRAKYEPDLQGPTRIEVTNDILSDDERAERLEAILKAARDRRDGASAGDGNDKRPKPEFKGVHKAELVGP